MKQYLNEYLRVRPTAQNQGLTNLNDAVYDDHGQDKLQGLDSYALSKGGTHAYIGNLVKPLCGWIAQADLIVGCVAWMTHETVLSALAQKHCQIIVQKEDWLRPDSANSFERLRRQYDALDSNMYFWEYRMNYCSSYDIQAVRCVGMHNSQRSSAFPRMHHKFIVFCRYDEEVDEWGNKKVKRVPFAVWTGSFNITHNGTNSRENAVVLEDPDFAEMYYSEWEQMLRLSEPLDWEYDWIEPQMSYNES